MNMPTRCWCCGTTMLAGQTHLFVRLPSARKRAVLVEGIPAFVCPTCEESYIDPAIQTMVRGRVMDGVLPTETLTVAVIHFNRR